MLSTNSQTTREITNQLTRIASFASEAHPAFRKQLGFRLREIESRLRDLADQRLTFESTETWRTIYEDVLNACETRRYLSVAVIRSDDYWRDTPGERSLEFNYRLVNHGFYVHRLFVIDDFFWPRTARVPSTGLFHWIQGQRQQGIEVSLVRMYDLEDETDLIRDMGIYGSAAVGFQQTNFEGRTVRYDINFDAATMTEAEQRWNQLLLYASSIEDVMLVN
ncbi:MAG: hypothetical protein KDA92_02410 [Planctomycetales bacterium]|nr:hypothetical protein [Planctomycetales bacterium]MCA9166553.1 hypothetical protein [Planctomycetales bacterium]